MKKVIAIVFLAISSIGFVYYQLFFQPEIIEADYIQLDQVFTLHTNEVWEVKFSPNDSLLISGGIEENTKIWSRIDGKLIHNLKHPYGTPAVDFSSDGNTVCTGSYDGKARIWDVKTATLLRTLNGHEGTIWSIAYSPTGELIAGGGNDNKVIVWDSNTGNIVQEFHNSEHDIWEVVFDPSGEFLLSSGSDNLIRVYKVESGELLKTIEGHTQTVLSLAFSPDGSLLASGGDDKTVKIWDTDNWGLLHTLKGENEAIHSVVFVDNNRVLAGGTDKRILGEFLEYHFGYQGSIKYIIATLWDIEKEIILQTITQHNGDLGIGCDVSSKGQFLATPSSDKTVKIWNLKN